MDKNELRGFIFFVAITITASILIFWAFNAAASPADLDDNIEILPSGHSSSGRQAESLQSGKSAAFDPCELEQVLCGEEAIPFTGVIHEVSAYTSRVEETDDSPCVPAANFNFCEIGPETYDVDYYVASNAYPLYTKLEIEHLGTAIVVDRMNSRYGVNNLDVYFGMDLERALNFSKQNLKVRELITL